MLGGSELCYIIAGYLEVANGMSVTLGVRTTTFLPNAVSILYTRDGAGPQKFSEVVSCHMLRICLGVTDL